METNRPPEFFSDRGSERLLLSIILGNPDCVIEVLAKLGEEDFLSKNHRALFSVLKFLYDQGAKHFDLMAIADVASNRGVLDLIGGIDYIDALAITPVNKSNMGLYISNILDCSTKYKIYRESVFIQESVLSNTSVGEGSLTSQQILAESESRLLSVSMESHQMDDADNLSSNLRESLIEKSRNPAEVLGIPTGIPLLDKAINGLMPGSLTVVAARQKGGKSLLLTNIASNICYNVGIPILYIDTELSTKEVQMRVVSHLSGVPERVVTNGKFIDNDSFSENVWRACAIVEAGEFYHKYLPGFSMDVVKSIARKYHAREGIGALFFDYIKMPEVTGAAAFKEHQILGNIATGLKDLAGQLNIPVIAAAQIKRGDVVSPKTRFYDSDVADSDRIGRYCNNLLAIGQKSKKEIEEDGATCGTHRLQVLLARSGTPNFHGIDLDCNLPTLTMYQAEHQSYTVSTFDSSGGF